MNDQIIVNDKEFVKLSGLTATSEQTLLKTTATISDGVRPLRLQRIAMIMSIVTLERILPGQNMTLPPPCSVKAIRCLPMNNLKNLSTIVHGSSQPLMAFTA